MPLIKDDHVVETLTSNGADHPFDQWILPRGARCGKDLLYPETVDATIEVRSVGLVSVPYQVPRRRMGQDAGSDLCFEVSSRDRIAPDCAIRHPVRPIAALQRRMRFSAQLAGFCRIRCHQRRARRAEQASFSVLVSNLDFRVPRLRQIGERAR